MVDDRKMDPGTRILIREMWRELEEKKNAISPRSPSSAPPPPSEMEMLIEKMDRIARKRTP